MILYMTYWFPQATRARFIALFLAAVPAASVIGGADLGLAVGLRRRAAWLAMDAAAGRHSVAAAGRRGALAAARPARHRQMAERGGESGSGRRGWRRTARRHKRGALHRLLGDAGRQAHLDFHHSGFFHRDRALWHGPVDAADDQGAGLLQSGDRLPGGAALCRRHDRDGGCWGFPATAGGERVWHVAGARFRAARWGCWARCCCTIRCW